MPRTSQLARFQQVLTLSLVLAAAGWIAWRWPQEPVRALLGGLAILATGPIVLFIEFIFLGLFGGSPEVPAPSWPQIARAWFAESCDLYRVFHWRQPFRWDELDDYLLAEASGRTGVVLVHGFFCNRGIWTPWMREFRRRGIPYVAVNLEPVFTPIDDYAPIVGAAIERVRQATGEPPVVVAHSMGGLATRAWLRAPGHGEQIRHFVTIGSPHAGTGIARFSHLPNGRQMRRGCEWLGELARQETGTACPPTTCWYSNCDNIVFPADTATLPGADNRLVQGLAHVDLAFHAPVLAHTLTLVEARATVAAGT
jgi:triacylglycerol lipase